MRKKKWLCIIICITLAAIVCRGIVSAITQKQYAAMPCEFVMPESFSLPDSRLVAIGTATHGNGDPFAAALAVLREMYAAHRNVALILEENVGDAEAVGLQRAYSGELGENVGFYLIYENQEMADILNTGWQRTGTSTSAIRRWHRTLRGSWTTSRGFTATTTPFCWPAMAMW